MNLRKILVPVADPGNPGPAAEFATALSHQVGAEVTLLHVLDAPGSAAAPYSEYAGQHGASTPDADIEPRPVELAGTGFQPAAGEAADMAQRSLAEQIEQSGLDGAMTTAMVTEGEVAESILSVAHAMEFDMVAMEAVRKSRLARMIFGSTLDQVKAKTQVPVVIFQPDEDIQHAATSLPDAVIVPLDGEPDSEHVVSLAQEFARRLRASIEFVHAIPDGVSVIHPASPLPATYMAATSAEREGALDYLDRFVQQSVHMGLSSRATVGAGHVVSVVQKAAESHRNAMIVTDSSDRSGLVRLFLGSVPEDLVDGTGSAVMVVPGGPNLVAS